MSLLAVERTKLTTTRSPWWCLAAALVVSLGFALLFSALADSEIQGGPQEGQTLGLSPALVVTGASTIGLYIIMIMATLAVTTEYRFGVIRTTFLAAPNRSTVIATKAAFLGIVGLVVGEVLAFAAYGLGKLVEPDALAGLSSAADWRSVAGVGVVYGLGSVLAVAVGTLLRQSAGAIALIVLFPLLVEQLVQLIPTYGSDIRDWMPFANADNFTGSATIDGRSPWFSLAYFAVVVLVVLAGSLVVVNRRDA